MARRRKTLRKGGRAVVLPGQAATGALFQETAPTQPALPPGVIDLGGERFYTAQGLAHVLGLHEKTIRRYHADGLLHGNRIGTGGGRLVIFSQAAVRAFLTGIPDTSAGGRATTPGTGESTIPRRADTGTGPVAVGGAVPPTK